jgi:hypothetical protein
MFTLKPWLFEWLLIIITVRVCGDGFPILPRIFFCVSEGWYGARRFGGVELEGHVQSRLEPSINRDVKNYKHLRQVGSLRSVLKGRYGGLVSIKFPSKMIDLLQGP